MKLSIYLLSLWILFVYLDLPGKTTEPQESSFDSFIKQINVLEKKKRYAEAHASVIAAWDRFPGKRFELLKEQEYLNMKRQLYAENLKVWKKGHELGFFFLLHPGIKKYAPYLQFRAFSKLVKRDTQLRQAALSKTQTLFSIKLPGTFDPERAYPLFIVLHGGGSNLNKAMKRWIYTAALNSKYIMMYVQSYRHYDTKSFGWRSSDSRAHRELKHCLDTVLKAYRVDPGQIYIGGVSAGGTMAFDLAIKDILPIRGVFAICPGKPAWLEDSDLKNRNFKVYMVGGEHDHYLKKQEEMTLFFKKHAIPCHYEIISGMKHEFVKDYRSHLTKALGFIGFTEGRDK